MRTDEAKRTMINAIMHERERLPRESQLGNKNHERADTLVGIINGTITEDQVDEKENDDELSETDAVTCRDAFRWLEGNDDVKLVDDEDLQAVSPKSEGAAPAADAAPAGTEAGGSEQQAGE